MPSDPLADASTRGPGRPRRTRGGGEAEAVRSTDDAGRESKSGDLDVRERLLDSATSLAVEQGFDACGLREIARRAGVSPGMIAYYFGDRQGLYEAMFERAFARISDQVRTLLGDSEPTSGDRLDELIRIQVSAMAADPWLPMLVIREVLSKGDSPWRDRFGQAVARGPLEMMIHWLTDEQSRGLIRADIDPRMLALTLASLAGFPFLMLPLIGDQIGVSLDDEFPDRLIEHNLKILSHGLRARSEEVT